MRRYLAVFLSVFIMEWGTQKDENTPAYARGAPVTLFTGGVLDEGLHEYLMPIYE